MRATAMMRSCGASPQGAGWAHCEHEWEDLDERVEWFPNPANNVATTGYAFRYILQRCRHCWLERVVKS